MRDRTPVRSLPSARLCCKKDNKIYSGTAKKIKMLSDHFTADGTKGSSERPEDHPLEPKKKRKTGRGVLALGPNALYILDVQLHKGI